MAIDLSCGEIRVIGNQGDKHIFRLSNSEDEDIISSTELYSGEFVSDRCAPRAITLDLSELDSHALLFTITITNGVYIIKNTTRNRTLLLVKVDSK